MRAIGRKKVTILHILSKPDPKIHQRQKKRQSSIRISVKYQWGSSGSGEGKGLEMEWDTGGGPLFGDMPLCMGMPLWGGSDIEGEEAELG